MLTHPRQVKRLHTWLSILVIVALVLPASVLWTPNTAQATVPASLPNHPLSQAVVATPAATQTELDTTYLPTFDPIPEPQAAPVITTDDVAAASEAQAAVDTEAGRPGIAAGDGVATMPASGGTLTIGALPLTLTVPSAVAAATVAPRGRCAPRFYRSISPANGHPRGWPLRWTLPRRLGTSPPVTC